MANGEPPATPQSLFSRTSLLVLFCQDPIECSGSVTREMPWASAELSTASFPNVLGSRFFSCVNNLREKNKPSFDMQ